MPLEQGKRKQAFGQNVKTEMEAGKSQKQAVAIAYATAGDAATASGIVFHANGKVLLLQRPDGTWGLPAGRIEEGETPEQAARRETMEETTHLHNGDLQSIGVFDGFFNAFFADCEPFDVVINEEHTGHGWFAVDELPSPLHGCMPNIMGCVFGAMACDEADTAKRYDINGFFEVMDNPVSKVGVFQYLGKNIPQEVEKGNTKAVFAIYRPAEELSDAACIASLRLKPWIIDHTMIGDGTGGTVAIEQKQARGVTGERGWFDADDDMGTLKTNIMCWSEFLASSIAAGKVELSLGYRCVYEYKPGVFNGVPYTYVQRRIRFNHLATVNDGRMGPEVAVMDGRELTLTEKSNMSKKTRDALLKAKQKTVAGVARARLMAFAMDAEEAIEKGEDKDGTLAEAVKAIQEVAPLLEAVEEIKAVGESDVMAAGDTMLSPGDERQGAANGLDAEDPNKDGKDKVAEGKGMDAAEVTRIVNKAVKDALASHTMDSRDVVRIVADRDALVKQVSEHIADFPNIATAMDAQEVAAYAVEKLEIPVVQKGQEIAAFKAWAHKRTPAHKLPVSMTQDAKDAKPSFLQAQLAERS